MSLQDTELAPLAIKVYPKASRADYGPGTWMHVALNNIISYGRSFMNLHSHRIKESCNNAFTNYISVDIREISYNKGGISSATFT